MTSGHPAAQTGAILMAAPNGARRSKSDHPNLPITAEEIAREAAHCCAAGASVLHLHVRDEEGRHTLDAGRYREAIAAVRERLGDELVIQVTSEAVGRFTPEDQIALGEALRPEAISIALREIAPNAQSEERALRFLAFLKEIGCWVQIILYDAADLQRFRALQRAGRIPQAVPSLLFVLGRYTTGQVSDPDDLDAFLAALGDGPPVRWCLCAFGPRENACMRRALEQGGDARVGFENNLFMPDGRLARRTADLVGLACESALAAGRRRLDAAAVRELVPQWNG